MECLLCAHSYADRIYLSPLECPKFYLVKYRYVQLTSLLKMPQFTFCCLQGQVSALIQERASTHLSSLL